MKKEPTKENGKGELARPSAVPPEGEKEYRDALAMPLAEAERQAKSIYAGMFTAIMRLAMLVRRIKEEDGNLSWLAPSTVEDLLRIAYGQMIPELLTRFEGRKLIRNRLAALPIPEQRKAALDEPLEVVEETERGFATRMIRLSEMIPSQLYQVVDTRGHIRTPAEQTTWIKEHNKDKRRAPGTDLVVNEERQRLEIEGAHGPIFITRKMMADFVARWTK